MNHDVQALYDVRREAMKMGNFLDNPDAQPHYLTDGLEQCGMSAIPVLLR